MKERPILFSAPMARAILDGRKTQTRRVVKSKDGIIMRPIDALQSEMQEHLELLGWRPLVPGHLVMPCPYGQPGDRLWVREEHYRYGHWEAVENVITRTGLQKWAFVPDSTKVLFDAPSEFRKSRQRKDPHTPAWHKRLARFMPHWASQITLEVTGVRVERLQDISAADSIAEGVECETCTAMKKSACNNFGCFASAKQYQHLWETINGPDSWDANPWVWVVEFQRVIP